MPRSNQVAQPLGRVFVNFVVVSSHSKTLSLEEARSGYQQHEETPRSAAHLIQKEGAAPRWARVQRPYYS